MNIDFKTCTDKKTSNYVQKIKILSPTDCVKDRLATYIYFKDRVGIEQALMVAKKHPVNLTNIKNWCEKENASGVFEEFIQNLKPQGE